MAKFLIEVDYSAAGSKGMLQDGGSKRKAVVEKMIKKVGGKLEAFYFTFGIRDAVLIVDLPDNQTAAGISLAVSATGSVAYKTTVLLTPQEIDEAVKKGVAYTPPGG
jgi:uncharacterized protein with GYD domain